MINQLDTKKIGQTISKLRTHRDIKAKEVASFLKIKEQAYPVHFITNGPESIVENVHNSVISSNNNSTITNVDANLIDALKFQLLEKDKQIQHQLSIIEKFSRP